MTNNIKQLYTYFGSKKKIVDLVWEYLSDVTCFLEPFAGTAVVAINRPAHVKNVYLNDYDCHIVNVLRACMYKPEELIDYICHPRLELDLHMISDYLSRPSVKTGLREKLMTRLDYCDARMAGWWVWGINHWIGGSWCNCILQTPDALTAHYENPFFDGDEYAPSDQSTKRNKIVDRNKNTHALLEEEDLDDSKQVSSGRKKLEARNRNTHALLEEEDFDDSKQVSSWRMKLAYGNQNTHALCDGPRREHVAKMVNAIYNNLSETKIMYGDFERVLTDSYINNTPCGVFLDPPYVPVKGRDMAYGASDTSNHNEIFERAKKWFLDNRKRKELRIILCGHSMDFEDMPKDVKKIQWKRGSGYCKNKVDNAEEMLCLSPTIKFKEKETEYNCLFKE
jgi:site-specific DNA-adenine methylase